MKVGQVVRLADDAKPNAFSDELKIQWINEVEGMVQTEVLLRAIDDVITYDWEEDRDAELLVKPPHDKLYLSYLIAMIDYHNGEYSNYENTYAMFNARYLEFRRWFVSVYHPADTHGRCYGERDCVPWHGYYLDAYGVWLKAGNTGTIEDFLLSIKGGTGDRGAPGQTPILYIDDEGYLVAVYVDATPEEIESYFDELLYGEKENEEDGDG